MSKTVSYYVTIQWYLTDRLLNGLHSCYRSDYEEKDVTDYEEKGVNLYICDAWKGPYIHKLTP